MVVVVGMLVGLVGVVFEKSVNWVQNQWIGVLVQVVDYWYLVWLLVFILLVLLVMVGYFLVCCFVLEVGGFGILEIEGVLEELWLVCWWCVLLVKFVGGMGIFGVGMVLGCEGLMVQFGGNIGCMVLDVFCMCSLEVWYMLLVIGVVLGFLVVFNVLLVGILFIIEEMCLQFCYNLIFIKVVFIGVIMLSIVFCIFNGEVVIIEVGKLSNVLVNILWLYLVLGMLFGCFGLLFNFLVLCIQDLFQCIYGGNIKKWVLIGGLIGGFCGLLGLMQFFVVGGGFNLIFIVVVGNFFVGLLLFIFIVCVVIMLICFFFGVSGGIFVFMLVFGMLLGMVFGMVVILLFLVYYFDVGIFVIVGMGVLFVVLVCVLLIGIVLVFEMIDNYQFILLMIIICFGVILLV